MAFFEDLTKKTKDLAYVAADKAKDVAAVAADKAKDAAELTRISMAIAGEQREIDKNYRTIGEWFVSEYEGEIPDAVRDLVEAVNTSKAKIAELQLKELEGKMHRSEDVEALTNDLVYTARSMIMALPGRLAMDVVQAGSANEASALIRTECYKILDELAGYQYDPEAYRRRVRDREGWSDALADEEADE